MRTLAFFRFELKHRLRQISTWVWLVAILGSAVFATLGLLIEGTVRQGNLLINSPSAIAATSIILSMLFVVNGGGDLSPL